MCRYLSVARSSYYYWIGSNDSNGDKDAPLIESIRDGQSVSHGTYGYRRMTIWLSRTYGITVNNKRVRRIMKKAWLQSAVRRRKKKLDCYHKS
ncbi:hypothetical protein B5F39_03240 [Cloacibacillus sp. An23]|nr:hypothetical protein B5F39_03240 [Cloacibacillus sp. An23]